MGYELHITRADHWLDSGEPANEITPQDWARVAEQQHDLVPGPNDDSDPVIYTLRDANGPSLYWSQGEIVVKGIRTQDEISELVAIADALGARLMGDDGERYE